MEREQWFVRAPRKSGEHCRQELLMEGRLDTGLRPRVEGDEILFPVKGETPERAAFEVRSQEEELPRHEMIGGIAIMLENDPRAARELLRLRPGLHTVLFPESEVEGSFRTRRFSVIAGQPTTVTTCSEYGSRYEIDLSQAYFSARLSTERQRICALVAPGERIIDMFAGVGPFAIALSRRAALVVAADINPDAVRLMEKNIHLNRVRNVLPIFADAAHLPGVFNGTFDRVVMNHPLHAIEFLDSAFSLCRSGGTIHCYVIEDEEGRMLPEIGKFPVKRVTEHYVRSYSPGRWHAAYDIEVE